MRTLKDWESATLAVTSVPQMMAAATSLVMAAAQPIGGSANCQPPRERIRNPEGSR
jgi:hypothetical protein